MSVYSELVKNFEKVRSYMRDFYLYGFRSRGDYRLKSSRSYDDEKRRLESWLGEYMSFVRTAEGKNMFISIDSRSVTGNPLFKAWKSKSFTDGDITLHFIIFDILSSPDVKKTLSELLEEIDEDYLSNFETPMVFDESTVRKKLKEYAAEGLINVEKQGRKVIYSRSECAELPCDNSFLSFFSEVLPCGVIGSFLLDKYKKTVNLFSFKHHYITGTVDSGALACIFTAMKEKRIITAVNKSRSCFEPVRVRIIPLRVLISVQSGRQHLFAYQPEFGCFKTYRVDYLSDIKLEEVTPRFDELRQSVDLMQKRMWGVSIKRNTPENETLESIDFTVKYDSGEEFIPKRLEREKRIGKVEHIDENTCRFSAEVYDAGELLPWIRTFICRITELNCSNKEVEERFKNDLLVMYGMYGIGEETE